MFPKERRKEIKKAGGSILLFTNECLWYCWVSCNNIPSNQLEHL